ncbi:hypothetical protein Scep_005436 [Stephania cephalantha]|uniref:Plastocyanin-like domain-containing protein n=1 Tax=Stephania cephalantha TaxID=152367 RepID=A0AAP0KUB6_9MAGN
MVPRSEFDNVVERLRQVVAFMQRQFGMTMDGAGLSQPPPLPPPHEKQQAKNISVLMANGGNVIYGVVHQHFEGTGAAHRFEKGNILSTIGLEEIWDAIHRAVAISLMHTKELKHGERSSRADDFGNAAMITLNTQQNAQQLESLVGASSCGHMHSETYLLRIINAALNNQLFFKLVGHRFTVVTIDAAYTNPYKTDVLVLTPDKPQTSS